MFTEKTHEELTQELINKVDPEIVGFNRTMMTSGLFTEAGPTKSYKLRDGKYYRSDISFAYWDGEEEVHFEEISREEFLAALEADYKGMSLAMLRSHYLITEHSEYLIQRLKKQEEALERAFSLVEALKNLQEL